MLEEWRMLGKKCFISRRTWELLTFLFALIYLHFHLIIAPESNNSGKICRILMFKQIPISVNATHQLESSNLMAHLVGSNRCTKMKIWSLKTLFSFEFVMFGLMLYSKINSKSSQKCQTSMFPSVCFESDKLACVVPPDGFC